MALHMSLDMKTLEIERFDLKPPILSSLGAQDGPRAG